MDSLAVYVLLSVVLLFNALAIYQGRRRGGGNSTALTEGYLVERLEELKSGLASELGRTRAAVELGMRDSADAYAEAQGQMVYQIDQAVDRLRDELLVANGQSSESVQAALEEVFEQAQRSIDEALANQATMLRDLKSNYERAIADLRAAVGQASAKHHETFGQLSSNLRGGSGIATPVPVGGPTPEAFSSLQRRVERLGESIEQLQRSVEGTHAAIVAAYGLSETSSAPTPVRHAG